MEEVNKNKELDNTDKKLHISDVMCSFFKRDEVRYRHGTCYKLFYGRIYCIQKDGWLGDFDNIFETDDKKVYENKVREMTNNGIVFKNYT